MTVRFTAEAIAATTPCLTPLRRRMLARQLGRRDDETLGPGEALVLWLANLLVASTPLREEQVAAVLEEYRDAVLPFGDVLQQALDIAGAELPAFNLALVDRTYAALTGRQGFLNLDDGGHVDHLSIAPLEVITYNLSALYVSGARRTEEKKDARGKGKAREEKGG